MGLDNLRERVRQQNMQNTQLKKKLEENQKLLKSIGDLEVQNQLFSTRCMQVELSDSAAAQLAEEEKLQELERERRERCSMSNEEMEGERFLLYMAKVSERGDLENLMREKDQVRSLEISLADMVENIDELKQAQSQVGVRASENQVMLNRIDSHGPSRDRRRTRW